MFFLEEGFFRRGIMQKKAHWVSGEKRWTVVSHICCPSAVSSMMLLAVVLQSNFDYLKVIQYFVKLFWGESLRDTQLLKCLCYFTWDLLDMSQGSRFLY